MVGRRLCRPGRRWPDSQGSPCAASFGALATASISNIKPPKHGPTKHKLRGRHYAASTGQTQWLQISLQKAESPTQSDINGFSTLHTAALYGRLDCMKMLIEKYHINVNLASLRGWRSIHLVLGRESKGMSLECLQYLLSKGADVNVQNQSGVSPLHKAASEGREDCLQVLIEAGGDVHAQDNEGQKPIDLCKMWGHRKCAKRLSHAMWQADKKRRLREMCRLEAIKLECQMKQREFIQKEQRDLDFYSSLAFEKWLAKKGLPLPSQYLLDISQIQRGSAMLRKVAREMASPILSSSSMIKGEPLESTMTVLWKYRQQKPWNLSTNLASEPATSIYRPDLVRLGVEPEKSPDHDFTSFLFLFRNTFGEPVIQIDNIGRVSPVPELSYEVLQNSLYPHTRATRLEVPKDLRPMHIFNLKHRRPLPPEHWWTDQMALSLRETLDPTFLGTLKTHFSTYCSAGAPSLSMVEAKGPPLSRAIRSSSSPAVCPTEQKGRDCPSTSKD